MLQRPSTTQRELLYASGALVSAAPAQGTSLDCLTLDARQANVPGSLRIVTIREKVLGRL